MNGRVPFPFPGPSSPFRPFDPCRAERWIEGERAVRCFCRESYRIEQIVNLTKTLPDGSPRTGVACAGDVIEIKGEGFRDSRDWGHDGLGESEVIFTTTGIRGVAVPAEDYLSWSDTSVEVRVPDEAVSGLIAMRIICTGLDIASCGVQLRHAAPQTAGSRRIAVPEMPRIEVSASPGTPLWCVDHDLQVRAANAEEVSVRDETGADVPFPDGAFGDERIVDGILTVRAPEDRVYTISARNACQDAEQTIAVPRVKAFELRAEHAEAGTTVEAKLLHHCRPAAVGLDEAPFALSYDDPDGALVESPARVVVAGDATEATIPLRTRPDACGRVVITAEAENAATYAYPSRRTALWVYNRPSLEDVRLLRQPNACNAVPMEITGNSLVTDTSLLDVMLTSPEREIPLTASEIVPGPASPSRGAVVHVTTPGSLGEERYEIRVRQFGLTSNSLMMTSGPLRIPGPGIGSFTSSRSTQRVGVRTPISLSFDVYAVERVEIWAFGGQLGRDEELIFRRDAPSRDYCAGWSGETSEVIEAPPRYELRAYGYSGLTLPFDIEIAEEEVAPPREVVGIKKLYISNCEDERHTIHVWRRQLARRASDGTWQVRITPWSDEGGLQHGYNEDGTCPRGGADRLELSFADGGFYELMVVDPSALNCGSGNDIGDYGCWRYFEPLPILGDSDGLELEWYYNPGNRTPPPWL